MERAKVVARYADGRVIKGYTRDFSPDAARFHVLAAAIGSPRTPVQVCLGELKALFFVRDFAGNPEYDERKDFGPERHPGRKLAVEFGDGEILVGYTMGYDPQRPGFFLFPADPGSNNLRVFAVATAVRQVLSPTEPPPNGPVSSPTRGGQAMIDPKLITNIQAVVNVLRQTVVDWESVVRAVEALTREHEECRARCAEVTRDHEALQATHARLRDERDEAVRAVTELRAAHDALRLEHEATARALADLSAQHESALRDRQSAAHELATILRRLQG